VTDLHEFGAVQTAIQSQLATYRAENCMISAIVCDGEKAFGKLKDWCGNMGVRMQPTGPNQHVSVADRSIRTLKNIGRSIANNLPYVLPLFLIKWLLLFAVNRFNILPYRGRGNGNIASPIELLNPYDICVFNKICIGSGKQITVAVYFDDLLISSECLSTLMI
jgi:hypothetical protein